MNTVVMQAKTHRFPPSPEGKSEWGRGSALALSVSVQFNSFSGSVGVWKSDRTHPVKHAWLRRVQWHREGKRKGGSIGQKPASKKEGVSDGKWKKVENA